MKADIEPGSPGGHTGPPLQVEADSIIRFAIRRGIREEPEQAATQMLALMQANARLEAELFGLRQALRELAAREA